MNDITFDIKELNQLIKDVKKLPPKAADEVELSTIKSSNEIRTKALINLIPHVKSGTLSRSLKIIKPTKKMKKQYQIISKVSFSKEGSYAAPFELGHAIRFEKGGKIYGVVKENPSLRPAADDSKEGAINNTIEAMNNALIKFGKETI